MFLLISCVSELMRRVVSSSWSAYLRVESSRGRVSHWMYLFWWPTRILWMRRVCCTRLLLFMCNEVCGVVRFGYDTVLNEKCGVAQ